MISKSLLSVLAIGAMTVGLTACNPSHSTSDDGAAAKANSDALTKAFAPVDGTYQVSNHTLADKIEGISLDSIGAPARGIIQGQILVKGEAEPVHFYSEAVESDTLFSGVMVDIAAQLPEENEVGGPLTGTFKCLDNKCAKAGVYFRFYQGAGYIFQKSATGWTLVNSVGATTSLEAALARRAVVARK